MENHPYTYSLEKNKDETICPYPHHMFYYYQHLDPPSILKNGVLTHNLSSMFEGYLLEGLGVCITYMHHAFIYRLQEVYARSFETRLQISCVVVVAATIRMSPSEMVHTYMHNYTDITDILWLVSTQQVMINIHGPFRWLDKSLSNPVLLR